jgi:hypothetical protein
MTRLLSGILLVALLPHGAWTHSVQGGRTQVSYDVEFSTVGLLPSGSNPCQRAMGSDKLTGTLTGWEPAPAHKDNTYAGVLLRDTDLTVCDVAPDPSKPGEHTHCWMRIVGSARVPVEFELYADQRGGYLKAQDTAVTVISSSVTGSCDPAEMAQLQADYGTMSTAGSPDGQPLEVPDLPRVVSTPRTFPANPPRSRWTLTATRRP